MVQLNARTVRDVRKQQNDWHTDATAKTQPRSPRVAFSLSTQGLNPASVWADRKSPVASAETNTTEIRFWEAVEVHNKDAQAVLDMNDSYHLQYRVVLRHINQSYQPAIITSYDSTRCWNLGIDEMSWESGPKLGNSLSYMIEKMLLVCLFLSFSISILMNATTVSYVLSLLYFLDLEWYFHARYAYFGEPHFVIVVTDLNKSSIPIHVLLRGSHSLFPEAFSAIFKAHPTNSNS